MDHEESSISGFTLLSPTSLSWQFNQQFPIFQNETPPNTTYDFKEVGQKGNKNLDASLTKRLDKSIAIFLPPFLFRAPTFVGTPSHEH